MISELLIIHGANLNALEKNSKVFYVKIKNLPEGTTQDQLIGLFSSAKYPVHVLPLQMEPHGEAIIELDSKKDRLLVIREFGGIKFNGNELKMELFNKKRFNSSEHKKRDRNTCQKNVIPNKE